MTPPTVEKRALLDRISELRAAGLTPKQIARTERLRPAEVAPLIRAAAGRQAAAAGPAALEGCWISPGWSTGLTIAGDPKWPDIATTDVGVGGMATVLVARRHKPSQVSVCGYLLDTFCLGVKNALGPLIRSDRDLPDFRRSYFQPYAHLGPPLEVSLDLTRQLVYGAVDAARAIGFEPAPDFAAAAGHLEPWDGQSSITSGNNGRVSYLSGPYDDVSAVVRTLNRTVGEGNFDFTFTLDSFVD
jgi:hypothetical protein